MAIITSAKTGNWEDIATWTGSVIPVATDDVTINTSHVVTINSNVNSFTNPIRVKGNLTIAEGGSLTIGETLSPYNYGTLELYGGSRIHSTGNGILSLHAGTIKSVGTSATNRAKFSCHMGDTPLKETHYKSSKYCTLDMEFVDFFGTSEQTTGMSISFPWRQSAGAGTYDYSGSNFIVDNCTFTNLNGTRIDGSPVSGKSGIAVGVAGWTGTGEFFVSIKNSDFRNVEGGRVSATTSGMKDSKDWLLQNVTFQNDENYLNKILILNPDDSETSAKVLSSNVVVVDSMIQATGSSGGWGTISNADVLFEHTNCLDICTKINTSSGTSSESLYYSTNENCKMTNGYSFFTETTKNPHIIGLDNLDGHIIESVQMDEPNHIMSSNNVHNCLCIGAGDMYNYVGTFVDKTVNFSNNTFAGTLPDSALFSMLLVENSNFTNTVTNVKNNLLAHTVEGTTLTQPFCRWVGSDSNTKNVPINLEYNAVYPLPSMGWLSPELVNTSSNSSSNIVSNPNFADSTRNLRTATTNIVGYSGNVSGNNITTPYLNSNGYTVVDGVPTQDTTTATNGVQKLGQVVDWVKAGFTPTNMSLATSGESGSYIGAMMPKEISGESADLTLSANKTTIELGETITFTLTLSQALSIDTTVVLTVDGTDRNCVITAGSTTDTTTHKPSVVGTKLISIKSTDNLNVNIGSPSSMSIVVNEKSTESSTGGYYWCGIGSPSVKVADLGSGSYNDTEVRNLITQNTENITSLENGKAEKPKQVQSNVTAPTLDLKNNEEYTFTNPLTSITINTQEGIGSIYFVTNSTFSITLPQSIIWDGGSEPEWKAFSIYVLVYFNGIIMASQGA